MYFEFHTFYGLVKYSIFHRIILKVVESGGMYKLYFSSFVSLVFVPKTSYGPHGIDSYLSAWSATSNLNIYIYIL